ncbi:MAG: LacI family DNA-binding transcriptional regulator [Victivallales bacterium]|nr:LacI family DNA-binding transcriptional regulator [Victivallales bacterium]
MTQKEIAKALNISRSTVSLALSGSSKVNPLTSQKVCAFAKKANYQPDLSARSLVTQKTNLVGVLLPSFAHRFLGELSNEIFNCLNAHGYSAIFGACSNSETYSGLLDSLAARKVDGIISYAKASEKLLLLHENGIPVVIYRRPGNFPLNYVDVDRYEGVRLLTGHLLESGRRRIAFIGGTDALERRFLGYQSALFDNNLDLDESLVVGIDGEMKEGREGMRILLDRTGKNPPDAVIFHNDSMAIGGMNEALRRGIKIPEAMAVAGFDDIDEAQYCVPGLTTVRQSKELIASALVTMLIEQIKNKNSRNILKKQIIAPQLIVRESSMLLQHKQKEK